MHGYRARLGCVFLVWCVSWSFVWPISPHLSFVSFSIHFELGKLLRQMKCAFVVRAAAHCISSVHNHLTCQGCCGLHCCPPVWELWRAGTYFARDSMYSSSFSNQVRRAALNEAELNHLERSQAEGYSARPAFLADGHAMLLCRVALGKVGLGNSRLRRPPPGFDSVCRNLDLQHNDIFAVFDNNQSYPEYIVHYQ